MTVAADSGRPEAGLRERPLSSYLLGLLNRTKRIKPDENQSTNHPIPRNVASARSTSISASEGNRPIVVPTLSRGTV